MPQAQASVKDDGDTDVGDTDDNQNEGDDNQCPPPVVPEARLYRID